MNEYDSGEMGRQPLDWVILSLRQMLNEKIVPILNDVLERPPMEHIDRAFTSLHSDGLLTAPNDDGELTGLGSFISKLGLDIRLGRLIGLGAMFGCLPECIAMACMLSATKSPFRIATELTQKDPRDYSETVNAIMHARHRLDCGVLSEPIMYINLLYLYRTSSSKHLFCTTYGLAHIRMKQLNNSYTHLLTRVNEALWKPNKFQQNKQQQKHNNNKLNNQPLFQGTAESLDISNSIYQENIDKNKNNKKQKKKLQKK
jgi:HrpA-like RNA helicase